MSLERELQFTASLGILKMQMKEGRFLWLCLQGETGVFSDLFGLGVFVSYPKNLLFTHLPEES